MEINEEAANLISKEYGKSKDINLLASIVQIDLLSTLVKQNRILIEQNQAIITSLNNIANDAGAMRLHFTGTYM